MSSMVGARVGSRLISYCGCALRAPASRAPLAREIQSPGTTPSTHPVSTNWHIRARAFRRKAIARILAVRKTAPTNHHWRQM